jgi:DNA polymerase III delta subunit
MLKFYFGEEDFLISQLVRKNKQDFVAKNPQALVEIFEAGDILLQDLLLAIGQGGGLFSSKKMVILKDVFLFSKMDQENILDFFKKELKNLNEVEILITANGKLKSSKLGNFLKKNSKVKEFKKISFQEIRRFVHKKLEGLDFESGVVDRMTELFGDNLWILDRELEKFINLNFGKKLTVKGIENLDGVKIEAKIFDLVDSIGNRNKARSLELLDFLLNKKENAFHIFSMIVYQFRNLALVFDCKNKGVFNYQGVAQKTGLHPFVAQKTLNQTSFFSASQVKDFYQQIFSLDIKSKSGKIEIKEALRDFIIKI